MFVHLHTHSEFSLVNGIVRLKALAKAVAAAGMPAVAVTDQGNLFGMVRFYKAAQNAGVKPIIGVDVRVQSAHGERALSRVVLLCQNRTGYLNLSRLITRSYLEGQQQGVAVVQWSWLAGATEGLIALSGGREGEIGQALLAGHHASAAQYLAAWNALFPDRYYLELTRTGREHEEEYIQAALDLAERHAIPVVATNDVHFIARDDFEAHEARVCIHEGRVLDDPRRPRVYSEQQYLRTPQEMAALFADIPEAIVNTVEIAKRCNLELQLGKSYLPDFPVPAGMTIENYFRARALEGLEQRLSMLFNRAAPEFATQRRQYDARLERELEVIAPMGFAGYFLIVADFIRWAREHDVPVGPGRGSGAGSLVAYALFITDLDPIRYDLLFERFLNPERVSLPDFDIDFCMAGRDRVIDYVVQHYGRDRVSQIITYGSLAAKAVVRDVGRVLGYPYGFVDQIAKLIPFDLGITLEEALAQEEVLRARYEQEDDVRTLIDLAQKLEGLTRNAGKHAGGVVIAPAPLTEFSPLYCEPGGESAVTQFDKDDVEAVGLVKFDFLGLRTLTIIDWAVKNINRRAAAPALNIATIPLDDQPTYELLKRCATTAVFQLESRGMKDLIKRLQPDCFEDIIALVALFRPGPLQSGMVDDFINRKHGRVKVVYPHPDLEAILKPTYGVILYQEQVMQIAQVLAGYTLGSADLLRRAMGKKKPEEMAKQRAIFTAGATARGVPEHTATTIFDLMEKFAGYGFNKSHSAAYALLSYQTAWLKAHYPADFMAAVLSADMDNTDKVVTLIDECHHLRLQVLPPNINTCDWAFTVSDAATIVYGLGAIKGVGEGAIESVLAARRQAPFADLFDFCRRIDARKVNRRVLEALIRGGAMDTLKKNRAALMASLDSALHAAEQYSRDSLSGQNDLFGGFDINESLAAPRYVEAPEWSEAERLAGEKETLGLYLTGHPIDRYTNELQRFITCRIVDLKAERDGAREQAVVIAGLVVGLRTMNNKRGERIAFLTLDDRSGRVELGVFADVYKRHRDLVAKGNIVVVKGTVSVDDYSGGLRMSADVLYDIDGARSAYAKKLLIDIQNSPDMSANIVTHLAEVLQPFRAGTCPVWIRYRHNGTQAELILGEDWSVSPSDELLRRLSTGSQQACLVY